MKYKIYSMLVLFLCGTALFAAEQQLYSGELGAKRNSPLAGTWEIVQNEEGEHILRFGNDFRSRSGPDLKIFFSSLPLSKIGDRNAANRTHATRVAVLKKTRGTQEYILPESLTLSEFRSWYIHCERYAHLWDGADLIVPDTDPDPDTDTDAE